MNLSWLVLLLGWRIHTSESTTENPVRWLFANLRNSINHGSKKNFLYQTIKLVQNTHRIECWMICIDLRTAQTWAWYWIVIGLQQQPLTSLFTKLKFALIRKGIDSKLANSIYHTMHVEKERTKADPTSTSISRLICHYGHWLFYRKPRSQSAKLYSSQIKLQVQLNQAATVSVPESTWII